MEHTEEPSYLDLLPRELREQVATNILPVIPEVPPGLSIEDFERGTVNEAGNYQRWMNAALDEYLFRPQDQMPHHYNGMVDPMREGKVVRRVMDIYKRQRDQHLKLAEDIRAIPIVKHIRKQRNRRSVLKKH